MRGQCFSITTTMLKTLLKRVNGEDFHLLTVMSVDMQSRSPSCTTSGEGKGKAFDERSPWRDNEEKAN
jgi:hypothetical protein